jgi:cell wall-associated NlpC family hydrolase
MPNWIRCFLLVGISALALAPAASAHHHWHDQNSDGQNWDQGTSWNDNTQPTQPAQPAEPVQQVENQGWNPNQGDPQETPSVWNQTPPANDGHNDNPWSSIPELPISKTPTVSGKTAMIRRNGLAAVPKGAPARVRAIISAANQIIGKPYKWGGGHGRLFDSGYDCSGSVSYALIRSGLLGYPMVSGSLARWGAKGEGKYVTIYANASHVYMEVAGLRLDTSSVGDRGGKSGVRWRPPIGKRFGFAVRHVGGI